MTSNNDSHILQDKWLQLIVVLCAIPWRWGPFLSVHAGYPQGSDVDTHAHHNSGILAGLMVSSRGQMQAFREFPLQQCNDENPGMSNTFKRESLIRALRKSLFEDGQFMEISLEKWLWKIFSSQHVFIAMFDRCNSASGGNVTMCQNNSVQKIRYCFSKFEAGCSNCGSKKSDFSARFFISTPAQCTVHVMSHCVSHQLHQLHLENHFTLSLWIRLLRRKKAQTHFIPDGPSKSTWKGHFDMEMRLQNMD